MNTDNIEITKLNKTYYILHICKNNSPVPLFYSNNYKDIKNEIQRMANK